MRLLFTVLIVALIGGGTWAYVEFDNRIDRSASNIIFADADGEVTVDIRRTFDCYGDPDFEEDAIRVTYVNEVVFRSNAAKVPASEIISFAFAGAAVEQNSLTVFANTISPDAGFLDDEFSDDTFSDSENSTAKASLIAMQVTVSYGGDVIAEKVFHDDGSGISIGGAVDFVIPEIQIDDRHNH